MKKWFFVIVVFFLVFTVSVVHPGEKKKIFEGDLTGDGSKETIYFENLGGGSLIYKKILIMKNSKNIFPDSYPAGGPYLDRKGNPLKIVLSNQAGIFCHKFDQSPGLQVCLFVPNDCFVKNNINQKVISGQIFRYNHTINEFELYKIDKIYCNEKYFKENISNKAFRNKIVQSFKQKTEYMEAFDIANRFLALMKQGRFEEAQKMCTCNLLEDIKYQNKIRPEINIKKAMSYYKFETCRGDIKDSGIKFIDGAWTACFGVTVGWNRKISSVGLPINYYNFKK